MWQEWPYRLTILGLMLALSLVRIPLRGWVGRAANRQAFRRDPADAVLFAVCSRIMALGFFLYILAPRFVDFADLPLPAWLRWLAVLPAAGGLWLLAAADRALGANLSVAVQIKEAHTLTTSGPYRYIRHPIYTAGLLIFVAVGIIAANWLVLACMAGGMGLLYAWRMPREDRMLAAAFGAQWRDWRRRTPALIPRFWPPLTAREEDDDGP